MSRGLHIFIVEPSQVLVEGFASILVKSGIQHTFRHLNSFSELEGVLCMNKKSVIVLNPSVIQHNPRLLTSLRNEWPETRWIAFEYSLHDPQLLSIFDGIIHIYDSAGTILDLMGKVYQTDSAKESNNEDVLSEREKDVLQLLALGKSNKEIAEKLNISINTVITHRRNISQKTGIRSVSGLTIYAVVNKLINIDSM